MDVSGAELQQLRDQVCALETRVEELHDFTSLVAHDLDAPARRIEAFAELLAADHAAVLPESGAEYLRFIESGAHRLRELLAALLEYSRFGAEEIVAEPVDVDALLAAVVDEMVVEIDDPEVSILASPVPDVLGSRAMLGFVLRTVIREVIRTRVESGPLKIRIGGDRGEDGESVILELDTRDGVATGDDGDATVFHPEHRKIRLRDAHNTHTLGPAAAARVVLAMGGRAWAANEGPVHRFRIQLPAAPS